MVQHILKFRIRIAVPFLGRRPGESLQGRGPVTAVQERSLYSVKPVQQAIAAAHGLAPARLGPVLFL